MAAHNEDYGYEIFADQHKMQLVMSGVPSIFWADLHEKLKSEQFDAGDHFSMIYIEDNDEMEVKDNKYDNLNENRRSSSSNVERSQIKQAHFKTSHSGSISGSGSQMSKWKVIVSNPDGISVDDASKIFLIDHAWTFKPHDARVHLQQIPGLIDRMASLTDSDSNRETSNRSTETLESVMDRLWLYTQTYTVNKDDLALEEKLSVWYVMDEFGSRIRHHDEPKFRIVPFYYVPKNWLYNLLFPIAHSQYGDEVTRDFVEGTIYHKPEWRDYYLLPWFPRICTHIPVEFVLPDDKYFQAYEPISIKMDSLNDTTDALKSGTLKIYAENDQIVKHLKHPSFVQTDEMDEADIWWLQSHFKDYNTLVSEKPNVMINQFPCESVLTVKDLLAACVHLVYKNQVINEKSLEFQPHWFCTTYNLRTELPQFISYFQKREEMDLDNTWIIKPWNLARSLDTFVTNNLKQIIRLIDSGPKVACKYVEDPVLFYRPDIDAWVKYDLRFIVCLKSVQPLKLFVYNNFWLRFAMKQFSLDNFDDVEKHFTVFNYLDKNKILQMRCEKFVEQFSNQYPGHQWKNVQNDIYKVIKETFEIATTFPPPKGLANLPQCRAMYGLDLMLKWSTNEKGEKYVQPVLIEVNYMPDCERACDYYADFADTVFQMLFLNDSCLNIPVTTL